MAEGSKAARGAPVGDRVSGIRMRARYLIIDLDVTDGETLLPSGHRGHAFASFHSPDLALELARAERKVGRRIYVFDTDYPWCDDTKLRIRWQER